MPSPANTHRLRKHADYQRVYKAGRKQFRGSIGFFFSLRAPDSEAAQKSPTAGPRIGLTVPKALGGAVDRNRIKRRMREAVRAGLPLLTLPVDLVLHPRRSALTAEFGSLKLEVAEVFRAVQANAAKPPRPETSGDGHRRPDQEKKKNFRAGNKPLREIVTTIESR
jgi:ribonuclease P protein component